MRSANPGPEGSLLVVVGLALAALLLLLQALFVVPAGEVAVITTLGKVSGLPRQPGLNFKLPLVQQAWPFTIRTQVRPEQFATLTKDLQVIQATATVKYALRPDEAGRVYSTIASSDRDVYPRIIQPSLLKALKSVFSQYELVTIASEWNDISALVERTVAEELDKFDYVEVRSLDLTGLEIAEEYRAAIEQKQIAEQQLLRAQTEVKIAEQEALRYDTLNKSLDDQVLYKLFLDKWDGQTQVVPGLPGSGAAGTPPVIVGRR
ncbi:MAG: prohibitin family protein [Synechococcus sp. MED-G71]|nr:MAG: prohibitin family protein [Synechococcus sp. MED-G71]RPF77123.1 MAG: prohibitin family protein [Synechococcus sp. TMED155]|tara:strand:+ start:12090 stop:12878 length:789 start_codon:yes stop_codon:yes gene_type:complete